MTYFESDKIPGPKPRLLVGNAPDLLPDFIANFRRLHDKYGPVMRVSFGGYEYIDICDPEAIKDVCKDDEYFTKEMVGFTQDVALFHGRSVVTTATNDHDWILPHKILVPAFSAKAIKAYRFQMGECVQELIQILDTFQKSGEELDIKRYMMALTMEAIGRIGFSHKFNLLKGPKNIAHPFLHAFHYVQAMARKRNQSVSWMKWLQTDANIRFKHELAVVRNTIEDFLRERRANPRTEDNEKDILDYMLKTSTKEGEHLNEKHIRDNMVALIDGGYETTSGFLSWTILELCRHPDISQRISIELANAGIKPDEIPTPEQVKMCTYLDMVIQESLRYHPPFISVTKVCKKDCTIKARANEYQIKAGQLIRVNIQATHKDPNVWEKPEIFDPSRFADPEANKKRHHQAWIPFSDGPRGCLGRYFALQEGKLALIMMLSKFRFAMDDPSKKITYQITTGHSPVDFFVKVFPVELHQSSYPNGTDSSNKKETEFKEQCASMSVEPAKFPLPSITFLYGTQTNTSEEYACKLASQAKNLGFREIIVDELDNWKVVKGGTAVQLGQNESQPKNVRDVKLTEIVVITTATYNGNPPDNATQFDEWLSSKIENNTNDNPVLDGILYAVFGCGNRQWDSTFQAFPKKIDQGFEFLGGERLLPAGVGDANEDIDGDFSEWSAQFWIALMERYGQDPSGKNADIIISHDLMANPCDDFILQFWPLHQKYKIVEAKENKNQQGSQVTIKSNIELQYSEKSGRSTRHIEFEFPITEHKLPLYNAGDHLEIYPINDVNLVEEVASNLGFVLDSVFEIKDLNIVNLSPRSIAATIKGPCTIRNALTYYADLTGPPTRYSLAVIAKNLEKICPELAEQLKTALQSGKESVWLKDFVSSHRTTVNILRSFGVKEFSFKEFLSSMNAVMPRKYSISSGPSVHPHNPSITVGVVQDRGGVDGEKVYYGLASRYLQCLEPGTKIHAQIKQCKSNFHLPNDEIVPQIFICAGTGLSPFRGFLQERRAKGLKSIEKGGKSDAYLFFGCRNPEHDFIYKNEINSFVEDGTLAKLFVTYSRTGQSIRYVQHCLLREAELIIDLLENRNASVYVCGSADSMAKDVRRAFIALKEQVSGMSRSEAVEYMNHLVEAGRYNEDVWG
ncbi:uncharacterized protein VTP21DRAFT_8034 [Calcarisporiella thermophila]|uniref:uncharacterized protein n=1 Tax=Calcarisporiella thermophila TaxID=911321 RepID=UPI0037438C1B